MAENPELDAVIQQMKADGKSAADIRRFEQLARQYDAEAAGPARTLGPLKRPMERVGPWADRYVGFHPGAAPPSRPAANVPGPDGRMPSGLLPDWTGGLVPLEGPPADPTIIPNDVRMKGSAAGVGLAAGTLLPIVAGPALAAAAPTAAEAGFGGLMMRLGIGGLLASASNAAGTGVTAAVQGENPIPGALEAAKYTDLPFTGNDGSDGRPVKPPVSIPTPFLGMAGELLGELAGAVSPVLRKNKMVGAYRKGVESGAYEPGSEVMQLEPGAQGVEDAASKGLDKVMARDAELAKEASATYQAGTKPHLGEAVDREALVGDLEYVRAQNLDPDTGAPMNEALDNQLKAAIEKVAKQPTARGVLANRRAMKKDAAFDSRNPTPEQKIKREVYGAYRGAVHKASPEIEAADTAYANEHAIPAARRRDVLFNTENEVIQRPGVTELPDGEVPFAPEDDLPLPPTEAPAPPAPPAAPPAAPAQAAPPRAPKPQPEEPAELELYRMQGTAGQIADARAEALIAEIKGSGPKTNVPRGKVPPAAPIGDDIGAADTLPGGRFVPAEPPGARTVVDSRTLTGRGPRTEVIRRTLAGRPAQDVMEELPPAPAEPLRVEAPAVAPPAPPAEAPPPASAAPAAVEPPAARPPLPPKPEPKLRVGKDKSATTLLKRIGDDNEPGVRAARFLKELSDQDPAFKKALDFILQKKAYEATRFSLRGMKPTSLTGATEFGGWGPFFHQNARAIGARIVDPASRAASAGLRIGGRALPASLGNFEQAYADAIERIRKQQENHQ